MCQHAIYAPFRPPLLSSIKREKNKWNEVVLPDGEEGTIFRRAEEASSAQEAFYLLVQRRHGWVFCGWAYVYIIEGVGGGYGEV